MLFAIVGWHNRNLLTILKRGFRARMPFGELVSFPSTNFFNLIQICSYNDFSCVPPEPDYQPTWEIEKMTFAQKIHHMLSDERNAHCLVWMPHGRAFKILVPKFLETEVLPRYLGHSKYSRFLTQLRTHGFKHLTTGIDQSCYYHEVRHQFEHLFLSPSLLFLT